MGAGVLAVLVYCWAGIRAVRRDGAQVSEANTEVLGAYLGSDAIRTRTLYAKLSALGPAGEIAVNLLRATQTSERAKVYRRRSSRGAAYDTKGWAMENLAALLAAHAASLGIAWGWGSDDATPGFPWVFYAELPDVGQVSFHSRDRGDGPDYGKPWDGVRGVSGQRACAWAARLLDGQGTACGGGDGLVAAEAETPTSDDLGQAAGPSGSDSSGTLFSWAGLSG